MQQSQIEDRAEAKGKILVVDDDVDLLRLIRKKLNHFGYDCECMANGLETVERALTSRYDLLLLDYRLGDMTGNELIGKLKSRGCDIPFMVMTGEGDEKIAVEMMKLGAWDYLVKDQNFLDLLPEVLIHNLARLWATTKLAQAESALAAQEALYRTLIESVPHIIWMADSSGSILFLNEAWYALTGQSRKDSFGNGWVRALHPDDLPNIRDKQQHGYKNGTAYRGEYRLLAKGGTYKIVEFVSTPVRDKTGNIINWVGINTDITERKRAEEELRRAHQENEQLLASISSILIGVDDNDKITHWNAAAERTFGIKSESIIGKSFIDSDINWSGQEMVESLAALSHKDQPTRVDDVGYLGLDGKEGVLTITI
ncbi:PAS domain S-box protein, partial [bacterium]|nr:PAS domain S-box protein [bacterium]